MVSNHQTLYLADEWVIVNADLTAFRDAGIAANLSSKDESVKVK